MKHFNRFFREAISSTTYLGVDNIPHQVPVQFRDAEPAAEKQFTGELPSPENVMDKVFDQETRSRIRAAYGDKWVEILSALIAQIPELQPNRRPEAGGVYEAVVLAIGNFLAEDINPAFEKPQREQRTKEIAAAVYHMKRAGHATEGMSAHEILSTYYNKPTGHWEGLAAKRTYGFSGDKWNGPNFDAQNPKSSAYRKVYVGHPNALKDMITKVASSAVVSRLRVDRKSSKWSGGEHGVGHEHERVAVAVNAPQQFHNDLHAEFGHHFVFEQVMADDVELTEAWWDTYSDEQLARTFNNGQRVMTPEGIAGRVINTTGPYVHVVKAGHILHTKYEAKHLDFIHDEKPEPKAHPFNPGGVFGRTPTELYHRDYQGHFGPYGHDNAIEKEKDIHRLIKDGGAHHYEVLAGRGALGNPNYTFRIHANKSQHDQLKKSGMFGEEMTEEQLDESLIAAGIAIGAVAAAGHGIAKLGQHAIADVTNGKATPADHLHSYIKYTQANWLNKDDNKPRAKGLTSIASSDSSVTYDHKKLVFAKAMQAGSAEFGNRVKQHLGADAHAQWQAKVDMHGHKAAFDFVSDQANERGISQHTMFGTGNK